MTEAPALEVRELRTVFPTRGDLVRAVDGVSFSLARGERVAIVGESGSGKSVTALSIMRLVRPPGLIESGDVLVRGRSLLGLDEREQQRVRGVEVAMIFQDPLTSLNPVHTVGTQLVEAIRLHRASQRRTSDSEAGRPPRVRAHLDAARRGWTTTRTSSRAGCASA